MVPLADDVAAGTQNVTKHTCCIALVCSPGIIHIVSITTLLPILPVGH